MNVYKFGGASVKDAEGVKNLFKIINTQRENLIIVVSAMGKMTDALEVLCNSYFGKTGNIAEVFQRIQDFHQQIIRDLFGSADSEVNARVEALYQELDTILKSPSVTIMNTTGSSVSVNCSRQQSLPPISRNKDEKPSLPISVNV